MQKHTQLTYDRIKQFIKRELKEKTIQETLALGAEFGDGKAFESIEVGYKWGPTYKEGWYRIKSQIPKAWIGHEVHLSYGEPVYWGTQEGHIEATIFESGKAIGGLDFAHVSFRITEKAEGGEKINYMLQTYAHNAETTVHGREKPRTAEPEVFKGFHLMVVDPDIVALAYDMSFSLGLYDSMDERNPARAIILRALNEVCNAYRSGSRKIIQSCRRLIKESLDRLGDEFYHEIYPVGHAHLDTAWLWPLHVTHLKMTHTTAVQLNLMERYPDHLFVHSQASQYEWLENEHPELFERVRRAMRKGQWEALGSMWVEADCNLTGAESLVRQFLYGKRYFKQKFGIDTIDMWLPDVFGYSAALPQILNKFGIRAFLTQKLSWNQFNKIPHHTFLWQGIDGSKIWSHFPPADTYCGMCEPVEIAESVRKYKDAGRSDASLYVFGFGDGGGGPTEQHIEYIRRARIAPGMPAIATKKKAATFFENAMAQSQDLATWSGELYFELHRGTYTSQAANKKSNRESEFLMRDAEWLSCFSDNAKTYPQEQIEKAWKLILLNQFHDIIPGSSVREVYEDSKRDYKEIETIATKIIQERLESIGQNLDTEGMENPVAIFHNSNLVSQAEMPWASETVPSILDTGTETLPVQLVEFNDKRKIIFPSPDQSLGSVAVGDLTQGDPLFVPRLKISGRRMENGELSVRFDSNGNLTSIQTLDDAPVEFIAPGEVGNLFQLFDDQPLFWDAWDIDPFALETCQDIVRCTSFEIVERGPVRVAFEVVREFGKSRITQRISLGPTPGIRFDTVIDWHEDEKMLKVAFPLNVNTSKATYEIQFGHVERPTHRNTSWDLARFEVCAQKWADMSEGGHGVALINTGKYGYDALEHTLRLTLFRSPKAPDPTCDMGRHEFSYVLLPHYDQVQHSDVIAASYAINSPARCQPLKAKKGLHGELPKFVEIDDRNLIIESVKKAEDESLTVVRLYECHNSRGQAHLQFATPVRNAWLAQLDETKIQKLEVVDGHVLLAYKPFEIITVMVEF